MDTPVVLSHKTAWLFHHAPSRQFAMKTALDSPVDIYGLSEQHLTAAQVAKRIVRFLLDCGIPEALLDEEAASCHNTPNKTPVVDILVATPKDRTNSKWVKTHAFGRPFDSSHLTHAAPGLFVVNEALNFIQSPTWMEPLEVLEYGFELCGRYEYPLFNPSGKYIENEPRCTLEMIRRTLTALPNLRGAHRARRALAHVREGSRSPMETALALSVLLPQKNGGLGYRNIELNRRIEIPPNLKLQCASSHLEADIFAEKRKVDIEYDGGDHASLERRTHDADRTSAFAALGIAQRTLTARHFAHQLEFHRAMNGIASLLNVDMPQSIDFQRKQNDLRLALIRNWNGMRDRQSVVSRTS